MIANHIEINGVSTLLWGAKSDKVFIFVHGQGGNKEESEHFASFVCNNGYQVIAFDLPENGARKTGKEILEPWNVVKEFTLFMDYVKSRWNDISLFATSIGAYFSMLAFQNVSFSKVLFVSPIVSMEYLIRRMMQWANVDEKYLEQMKIIKTNFDHTLSFDYLEYAKQNPAKPWDGVTNILYGSNDNLIEQSFMENFAKTYSCSLSVMENGEHWFHTKEQLQVLDKWLKKLL